MKKYILTSLLLLFPFVSMATDYCTNPKEHTLDRRCYVTPEQKETKPYNATVHLNFEGCTGTIIKYQDKFYVYTAKHCVADEHGEIERYIGFTTQSGDHMTADVNKIGDFDTIANKKDRSGDWAIYTIPDDYYSNNIASTDFTKNISIPVHHWLKYDARVIGYGVLKIMSDKEISDYKNKYIQYLYDKTHHTFKGDEDWYGFDENGGVHARNNIKTSGPEVVRYLKYLSRNETDYYRDIFNNKELKVSYCGFSLNGLPVGCQIWGGNSGGGVFDTDGNLMAILTGYKTIIGGNDHAAASTTTTNVNFLTNYLQNETNDKIPNE